ncbi:cytochrome c maturation protein CcmE [bacterium]|nr:cytochrome c maturation protein CcmE [bacterium]
MNKKVIIILTILFSALSYLFISAFLENKMAYTSVSEFLLNKTNFEKKSLKIVGVLMIDTISQQKDVDGRVYHQFSIEDKKDKNSRMLVQFRGVMPGNMKEAMDVIVTGVVENGVLKADTMITKCPSKYENEKKHPDSIKRN